MRTGELHIGKCVLVSAFMQVDNYRKPGGCVEQDMSSHLSNGFKWQSMTDIG